MRCVGLSFMLLADTCYNLLIAASVLFSEKEEDYKCARLLILFLSLAGMEGFNIVTR